jgi:hypothetical protein
MLTNYVFLVDTERQPLNPIHPATAKELLNKSWANVLMRRKIIRAAIAG